jgi:hypothetical protein
VNAQQRQAAVEIAWDGGARSELTVKLNARGPDHHILGEDTVELIRRLAEHHPTSRSPRSSTAKAAAQAKASRSRARESKARGSAPAFPLPRHRTRPPTWSRSSRPPPSPA